jgi:tetratricopeptide (TPR) repeat protein
MRKLRQAVLILVVLGSVSAGHDAPPCETDEYLARAEQALLEGRGDAAETGFRALLERVDTGGPAGLDLARVLSGLGRTLLFEGSAGEARAHLERSLRILDAMERPDERWTARTLHALGRVALLQKRFDHARYYLVREHVLREARAAEEPLALARTMRALVRIERSGGDLRGAVPNAFREIELYERARELDQLAIPSWLEQAERDSAGGDRGLRLAVSRAAALARESLPDDAALADTLRAIGRVYLRDGYEDEALRWHERAWRVRPPQKFVDAMEAYLVFPGWKALARALDADGQWSLGFFTGEPSEAEAVGKALAECRRRLSWYDVDADCTIHAIGDTLVREPATLKP